MTFSELQVCSRPYEAQMLKIRGSQHGVREILGVAPNLISLRFSMKMS